MSKAIDALKEGGIKTNKDNETGALLMVSPGQVAKLASYVLENETLDKKEVKKILMEGNSLDLALFGRMLPTTRNLTLTRLHK